MKSETALRLLGPGFGSVPSLGVSLRFLWESELESGSSEQECDRQAGCCFRNLSGLLFALRVAVLSYENVVETGSETDEDDRPLVPEEIGGGEEEADTEMAGSPAGVPTMEASPRVGHALLSYRGREGSEVRDGRQSHHHSWRLGDDTHGHLNGRGE